MRKSIDTTEIRKSEATNPIASGAPPCCQGVALEFGWNELELLYDTCIHRRAASRGLLSTICTGLYIYSSSGLALTHQQSRPDSECEVHTFCGHSVNDSEFTNGHINMCTGAVICSEDSLSAEQLDKTKDAFSECVRIQE